MTQMDFEGICHLLSNGYTLAESLILLQDKSNSLIFENIRMHLAQGEKLSEFMIQYCPKVYQQYLNGFIAILPFQQSSCLALDIVKVQYIQKKELLQQLYYPIILFLFTLIGMIGFNHYCFPKLLVMIDGFHIQYDNLKRLHLLFSIFSISVLGILLGILILIFYFQLPKKQVKVYCFFSSIINQSIMIQYQSLMFVYFFLQCIKIGVSTKESIEILKSIQNKPIIHFLVTEIETSLLTGKKFERSLAIPYIDQGLNKFIQIAMLSSTIEEMLQGYINMVEAKIHRKYRYYAKVIQVLSYSMVGAIVILVYQVLLIPMTLFSQL